MSKILSVLTSKIALWIYVALTVIFIGVSVYLTYTGYVLRVIEHVSSIAWIQAVCFGLLASTAMLLVFVILQIVGISFEFKIRSVVLASCFLVAGIGSFLKIVPPTNTADQTEQVAETSEDTKKPEDKKGNEAAASDKPDDKATQPGISEDSSMRLSIANRTQEVAEKAKKRYTDSVAMLDSVKQCGSAKALAELQNQSSWYDNTPLVVKANCEEVMKEILQKKSTPPSKSKGGKKVKWVHVPGSKGTEDDPVSGPIVKN
jgi:hypothetical protein